MQSIDDTSQAMFGLSSKLHPANIMNTLQTIMRTVREAQSLLESFSKNNSVNQDQGVSYNQQYADYANSKHTQAPSKPNYTGNHSDIAFVSENGKISQSQIDNITDDSIRYNVQKSYDFAIDDGYLYFDNNDQIYRLTPKGNEHINSKAFMEQFEKDQIYSLTENKAKVKLQGNKSDLNVFRFTDSINLNHLSYSDPSAFKLVQDYFYECQDYNLLNISPNGTVTPTEKCNEMFKQNPDIDLTKFKIEDLSTDNLKDFTKALSGVDKATASSMSIEENISNEAVKQASKNASKEGAKAAAKQGTKNAVVAGTGAAAAGIGTAVTAVIELSQKGAQKLKELADTNKATPKLQNR